MAISQVAIGVCNGGNRLPARLHRHPCGVIYYRIEVAWTPPNAVTSMRVRVLMAALLEPLISSNCCAGCQRSFTLFVGSEPARPEAADLPGDPIEQLVGRNFERAFQLNQRVDPGKPQPSLKLADLRAVQ
jgi:hypothetical protein